jgi:hypothetical protein
MARPPAMHSAVVEAASTTGITPWPVRFMAHCRSLPCFQEEDSTEWACAQSLCY